MGRVKNDFCASVGKQLRMLRGSKGKTLVQVSHQTGLSVESIRLYETGQVEPGIEAFKRLCEYYQANAQRILGMKDGRLDYDS